MKDFFFHPYLCLTHRFWRGEKSLFHFSLNFSWIGLNVWEHTLLINGHYTYSHILWHFYHLIDHSVTTIKKKWTALLWMKMYTLFFLSETFHALDKFKWITPTPLLNLSFAAHQFLWNKYKFVINDDRHWRFKVLIDRVENV